MKRLFLISATLAGLLFLGQIRPALAEEPDWHLYQQLLDQHLSHQSEQGIDLTWLDYPAVKADPRFAQLVQQLAEFDPERLEGRQEQLAFYINAYNILAINVVVQNWPLQSIKDASPWYKSVWKIDAGQLGGERVSLDHVEHQVLRPLGEPRIHFAIVCASLSCPDLRSEPYSAERLEHQLDDQLQQFLANPTKGLVRNEQGLKVSKIFDWFEEDFGGEAALTAWLAERLEAEEQPINGYLEYNWSLNGTTEP
ncbi:DUF547 domain-containing protein [Motiliproteus coralliicola]|uniref:DUF547 domain-containing protein n=1 Tax=Motiliproteus coralliicola TaxID=2283196 RepID=UPI001403BBB4|nr:DUF547 domain-containing protein [Motiliproteus coralliicola]